MSFFKKPTDGAEWLGSVAFFRDFSPEQLSRVHELSAELDVDAGTKLVDQGDPGTDCFVIVDGQATVSIAGEHVATLDAGSMFGEMSLVDHRPRNASVTAESDMRLLRFDARQFRLLLDEMPKASERVMTMLTERMKRSD